MVRKNNEIIGLLCSMLFLFASCIKDKPAAPVSDVPDLADSDKVYIVCEGNYGSGNASLGLYLPGKDSVYNNVFQTVNKQPLGDVFQSMQRIGDNLYLCVNNSNKIVVISAADWQLVTSISLPQPRYILPVNSTKAYVSSEYSNKIYSVNPQTMQEINSISVSNINTEGMLLYNNMAYICTWDTAGNVVYVVSAINDRVVNTIKIAGYAPQDILLDKEQKIWVLSGDQPDNRQAAFTRIDPATGNILRSYHFSSSDNPVKPIFNNTRDTLYYIDANYYGGVQNNGVFRMSIYDTVLPAKPFIGTSGFQYFWALGIHPKSGNIYVGDPMGFTQNGTVYIYKPDGTLIKNFKTGLGPGHFYFDEL